MAAMSDGKAAWSPLYSITRLGTVTSAPQRSKLALELSPDQVDSHESGVTRRAKPTLPRLDAYGSRPHKVPTSRSEGSIDRSQHRRSASVRHTCRMGVWA